jgi:hypothetical protein
MENLKAMTEGIELDRLTFTHLPEDVQPLRFCEQGALSPSLPTFHPAQTPELTFCLVNTPNPRAKDKILQRS